ncbi:MAG: TRAP transporter small permease [Ignavibacteriae bacterium]|nr:TRAP transporter small permease [Ignavibacteriota bacterium]MCB9207092.1 TRAP transporter small permease [Ignavibacteriales bacterium]MCB9211185.1 TRAP transporter small permease [Ignavibacteriales bacterium]MCB9219452.1 TRAP transporter small permease [Ignavibacteriales bacterium]MCB9259874.1 TRAP transporter small permease [Ignavibacteriales bacterium]
MTLKLKIDKVLKWVLVIIMAAMTINVLWQVFTRFILQDPSSFTEELARYMLIWIGILGASYVAGQKMHLAIDLLSTKLTSVKKSYLEIFIQSMIFLFAFFVMVIGGIRLVNITLTLNQISAALQIPLGYVYSVVPLSGALMMFYSLAFIIEEFGKNKSS